MTGVSGNGYYDEQGRHVCGLCGRHTQYQALSGGCEFYCPGCETNGMYPEGEGGPRARLLDAGPDGIALLRAQMDQEIARRKGTRVTEQSETPRPAVQIHKLTQEPGEHILIVIESPDRPTISLDVTDRHGRRGLGVRVGGMGTYDALLDVEALPAVDDGRVTRFCPFCGEEQNLVSSRSHTCAKDGWQ